MASAMASFKTVALVLSLLAIQVGRVQAQSSSCQSGWEWMNNSVGYDPCRIVESLDSRCLGLQLTLPALAPGSVYAPPTDTNSPSAICDCNSPMYTLYSACAACQGAGWVKWSEWSAVCGVAHVGSRPDSYITTTPIPHWAFMNVTINDTFVPETAESIGGTPEQRMDGPTTTFTPTGSTTILKVESSSSMSSSSSSDLPSVTQTDTPKSKTPVGAIVGGVVGGFAVLSLLVFGLFFWRRRGLNIPRIRKATGPMSLFDPQERRPDLGMEEATVKRPLLYDPTNPATFSQVHAELERPLQPGGRVQSSIGYGDPYHPSLAQPSSNTSIYRYGGAPEAH